MIELRDDPRFDRDAFASMWQAAWGAEPGAYLETVLPRSLGSVGAFDGERPVGFVNLAWDGGAHAFLLDTLVHPDWRRQGIATRLVQRAEELARERGAHWLHVDYEPHLASFYAGCGFRPTPGRADPFAENVMPKSGILPRLRGRGTAVRRWRGVPLAE